MNHSMIKNKPGSNRRDFLRRLSLLSAGVFLPMVTNKAFSLQPVEKKKIAVQLWSLREILNNNIPNVLAEVSRIGFTGIEPYGFNGKFYDIEAGEFRKMCADFNLEIYSTHAGITAENAEFYSEKALEAGLRYIVLPSFAGRPNKTLADYQKLAEELNIIGGICNRYGLYFGYHNHDFEFQKIEGIIPYDILLKETESDKVFFQPDTYFFEKAGMNLTEIFTRYPGRFFLWHIKDMGNDRNSCNIGNGTVDFKNLIKWSEKAGLKLLIYEQEECAEGSPLICAEQSFQYIQRYLL